MNIRYLPTTIEDLKWFRQYYESVFPEGSSAARVAIKRTELLLLEHPYVGKESENSPEARELSVANTPFVMIYRIKGSMIEIIRLWDGRKKRY